MDIRKVDYKVKYIGEEDIDITPGKIYKCVEEAYLNGELLSLGIIDETKKEYQYSPEAFVKMKN